MEWGISEWYSYHGSTDGLILWLLNGHEFNFIMAMAHGSSHGLLYIHVVHGSPLKKLPFTKELKIWKLLRWYTQLDMDNEI